MVQPGSMIVMKSPRAFWSRMKYDALALVSRNTGPPARKGNWFASGRFTTIDVVGSNRWTLGLNA
jgi:hypothetical protein